MIIYDGELKNEKDLLELFREITKAMQDKKVVVTATAEGYGKQEIQMQTPDPKVREDAQLEDEAFGQVKQIQNRQV